MQASTAIKLDNTVEKYIPFMVEVRKRLFFILTVFLIFTILGFVYYEKVIVFVLNFFSLEGVNIVFTSPFQFINLAIASGLLIGLIVIFPLIIFQILSFLKPALFGVEYKTILKMLPVSILLFLGGFSFGVAVMRYVIQVFYEKSLELNIGNFLDISLLLSQILITSVLMGIAFQYPVVLSILMQFKILKYKIVAKQRLLFYSASIIFATLLPPTDLLSLALLSVPLVLLFELTLFLNKYLLKVDTL